MAMVTEAATEDVLIKKRSHLLNGLLRTRTADKEIDEGDRRGESFSCI